MSTLITSYFNPDIDGTACALAYAEFLNLQGREVQAVILGEPAEEAVYVLDRFGFEFPEIVQSIGGANEIILVDTSGMYGMENKIDPKNVVEIIDHREVAELESFPNAKAQMELVGACATLIAEKFMHTNVSISKPSATMLFAAIISNTMNFKVGVTTDRDRAAAAWLNQTAGLSPEYWKDQFQAKSNVTGGLLKNKIIGDTVPFTFGKTKCCIAQLEILEGESLVKDRLQEILEILIEQKAHLQVDFIILSIVALEDEKNYFVTNDPLAKDLFTKLLGVEFNGHVAMKPGLMLRKKIWPLIKAELES